MLRYRTETLLPTRLHRAVVKRRWQTFVRRHEGSGEWRVSGRWGHKPRFTGCRFSQTATCKTFEHFSIDEWNGTLLTDLGGLQGRGATRHLRYLCQQEPNIINVTRLYLRVYCRAIILDCIRLIRPAEMRCTNKAVQILKKKKPLSFISDVLGRGHWATAKCQALV